MKKANYFTTALLLGISVLSLVSCKADDIEGTYSHSYPSVGSVTIPGSDGFEANGDNAWLGGGKNCRINRSGSNFKKDGWEYNYKLDVYVKDIYDDTWSIPLTYANGNQYIGRIKENHKKIEFGGWNYSK